MRQVTLDAPRANAERRAALDIPIAELLPESAALGVPDGRVSADWSRSRRGEPYPMAATLAECGLDEPAVLGPAARFHASGTYPAAADARDGERRSSARTLTALPARCSSAERVAVALRALLDGDGDLDGAALGGADPGPSRWQRRVAPARRMRGRPGRERLPQPARRADPRAAAARAA